MGRPAVSNALTATFWLFTAVFVALEIYSLTTDSHYKWDFFFIMVLWVGLYRYRGAMNLHTAHYALFGGGPAAAQPGHLRHLFVQLFWG